MMKLLAFPTTKPPPTTLLWTSLHCLCCLISLLLGFRFSRLVFFLLFSPLSSPLLSPSLPPLPTNSSSLPQSTSRVSVGRHGIRIRPWPHPDPAEVMRSHAILDRVQAEQRTLYGVKEPRKVIVVTPTYVRTFQTLHLTGVMHSLMSCPYDVVWVVVEAGGRTNETAEVIERSGIRTVHVGFDEKMPVTWIDRQRMESRMRVFALRVVRDKKMDGIVMFADDSNMHSMELFDEVQKVRGIGAISVGILMHKGGADIPLPVMEDGMESIPVQGPACNGSESLVGWHTFNASPYAERSAVYIGDMGPVLPMRLEWAGFVLDSRLLWKEDVDKPEWMKDLESLSDDEIENPLSLVKDTSVVEPLGNCGRKVLLWWLRVEARLDSKFPPGWTINTPLEITVPAKRTPWPEAPTELPSMSKETVAAEDHSEKQPPKTRTSRSMRTRNSKKGETRTTDTQESSRQSGNI